MSPSATGQHILQQPSSSVVTITNDGAVADYNSHVMHNIIGEGKVRGNGCRSHRLSLYVTSDCFSCKESISIISNIAMRFPELTTEVVYLDEPGAVKPDEVFAVPTYLMDGNILFMGNPYLETLISSIQGALS